MGGPVEQAGTSGGRRPAWATTQTSAHARGYGARWRKLRKAKLAANPVCEHCKRTWATCVDHITPKAQRGDDAWENLQALCQPCHDAKTAREGGAGTLVPPDPNSWGSG